MVLNLRPITDPNAAHHAAVSAVKKVLDFRHQLSVCPATHTEDVQAKINTHRLDNYAAIIFNYRNVVNHLRDPQIIKFENAIHVWINIGYICERTFAISRVKSRFRARITDCNFIVLLLISSRISKNWSAPDSISYFINGD